MVSPPNVPVDQVAQQDTATTAQSEPIDEPQARFTWNIENFSRLRTKKIYSDSFEGGGYKWRVLIFPKGNNVDCLSMYLDVVESASLPHGWRIYSKFGLAVINQLHREFTQRKEAQHKFYTSESDWGFTTFLPLTELNDPSGGFLVNDTCIIEVDISVFVYNLAYNSKKHTGYVGLMNQGATYINSLLQTLYHIPRLRKVVYHMPTTENDVPTRSISLSLQSIFYKLQYNQDSVATEELTKPFGRYTHDTFMQHHEHKLNRVLIEKLEDKIKGTVVEGAIQELFVGHHMNYVECINVDFRSTEKESFHDIQLDVKGCRDVYASFDKYVEVRRLEGDNKFDAEHHGLQDSKKGVLFIDFPPILQLHLKRFEYDVTQNSKVKVNDRYEFSLQLDLDIENKKYFSPDADSSIRNLYTLHSVLVHSGGVHDGHYCAFIRPTLSDQWFKFDDERVTKEDMKRAVQEQYGSKEELPQTNPGFNNSNACMLVYIRESDKERIVCDVGEENITEHMRIRFKKEPEKENKERFKAEPHLYTTVKVTRDADFVEQIGKDIYFDLVDHERVRGFHIQKQMLFYLFKEVVDKEFGVPVQFQRFWVWAKRKNETYRPYRLLTSEEEELTVGQLSDLLNKTHNEELKLFLEIEFDLVRSPVCPPDKTKEDILLFLKLYDPKNEELRYVGRLFVKTFCKPSEILTKLKKKAGFDLDEDIELYEEIKYEPFVMCERLDDEVSWSINEIQNGDIICFQKASSKEKEQFRLQIVPSFLEYVHTREIIQFRHLSKPTEEDFCLELSRKFDTYDDVVERMVYRLGLDDPSKIRLTTHDCHSHQPKPHPVKYRVPQHLQDMLIHDNETTNILYYEVLDIPLPEFQCSKILKLAFHHPSTEVTMHNIRLLKQNTVGSLLNELKTQVELSQPDAELRLLQILNHKINKLFSRDEKIEALNDQEWILRAEEIPEEEKNLGPLDRLIHVYHFKKEMEQNQMEIRNFGEPFFLVLHERETLAEIKIRIQKKLQVADEEFCEWKIAFMSMNRPEYLQDSVIIQNFFQEIDVNDESEQYLGLEHFNTIPEKAYSQKMLQADVPETLGPLAAFLAKKSKVSKDHVPPVASSATHPKSLLQQKDCVAQAIRILEPHMSEDFAKIDDQSPEVIVGQALKDSLESFVGMHQAIGKFTNQLNSQSKKLEDLQVANNSLSIANIKAENALKAAEEKAAALEAELEKLRAEKLSWKVQIKAKEEELVQEKALRVSEVDDVCRKAREKALEEFGAEVGGLVNKYHFDCHIRTLTLAGLEPKDPRWYDVAFPFDGPTPPLKFPWEDERGSSGESS